MEMEVQEGTSCSMVLVRISAVQVLVLVEEADSSQTALRWAVRNAIRDDDSINLLHVCAAIRSKKKQRSLRRLGFQLALSFKDLCNGISEAKVEIIVMEGDLWEQCESVIRSRERLLLRCLESGCHKLIVYADLIVLLSSEKMEELFRASFGAVVSSSGGEYRFYPTLDCPNMYRVAHPDDLEEVGPFVCGACSAETCRKCAGTGSAVVV